MTTATRSSAGTECAVHTRTGHPVHIPRVARTLGNWRCSAPSERPLRT